GRRREGARGGGAGRRLQRPVRDLWVRARQGEGAGYLLEMSRPAPDEAATYYWKYIDRVANEDVVGVLAAQAEETLAILRGIGEERSRYRYAPDKWSLRELLGHLTDSERVFAYRALWFARGFETDLPSFDQDTAARAARADTVSWAEHIEEFRVVRLASVALFGSLSAEAWSRGGVASGNRVTVRALAYIIAGHE